MPALPNCLRIVTAEVDVAWGHLAPTVRSQTRVVEAL